MRQTGRTTRIIQYVVEQLFNVGTCIATDHVVYEHKPTFEMLKHFQESVIKEMDIKSHGTKKIKTTLITVDNHPYIKFEISLND